MSEVKKTTRSRRVDGQKKDFINKNGLVIKENYCRKCMKTKKPNDFYQSTDNILDSNLLMSICKSCISELYVNLYKAERTMDKTILRMCRILNIKFDTQTIESTKIHLKTQNKEENDESVYGIYKGKLFANNKENVNATSSGIDLSFYEPLVMSSIQGNIPFEEINYEEDLDVVLTWGRGLDFEDYEFLENEYSEWTKTHKNDTKAEKTLLQEICYKRLEIQKARVGKQPTAALIKELQEIMKTANVDPAKASIADAGKSKESFSNFIKIIEENEPADYYKDKALFKDYDNLDFYFRKYVTRPLKNFITQSRDFNVETDDGDDGSSEFNLEDEIVENGEKEKEFDQSGDE